MGLETYNAAKEYIAKGWHVFPLVEGEKIPAVPAWSEYKTRMPTDDELKRWFLHRNHNIAIVTGQASGLFVVDVDNVEQISLYSEQYPTGRIANTPRGGKHFIYTYAGDDLTVSVGGLGAGVDTRGDGGYIVAPPSVVEYNDPKFQNVPAYAWESEDAPAPLPEAIRQKLLSSKPAAIELTVLQAAEDGRDLFTRIMTQGFTPGKHNLEVKDAARYLFRMGLAKSEVFHIIKELNDKDATPLPGKELLATLKSGIGYEEERKQRIGSDEKPQEFRVMSASELLSEYGDYDVEWLIEGWLPENSLLGMYAPPETYKTWILLDAAVSVGLGKRGKPFMGSFYPTNDASPVLIVQQEDYIGQVMQRYRTILNAKSAGMKFPLKEWQNDKGQTVMEVNGPYAAPIYIHPDSELKFDNRFSMDALRETIKSLGIKLVVIDPLYMLEAMDDRYFAGAARGGMAELKQMRTDLGVSFIIAHHTNKKEGAAGRNKMFGSQLLNGAFEGVWLIDEKDGGLQIVRRGKFFPDRRSFGVEFNINTTPTIIGLEGEEEGSEIYEVTVTDIADSQLTGKYDRDILSSLEANDEPMIMKAIADDIGVQSAQIKDSLKKLVDLGHIVQSGRRYALPIEF